MRWIFIDPIIILFTGIMATISVFFSLFDGRGILQHKCAQIWARFIIKVSGAKIEIEGLEKINPDETYIITANHQSYFDIWTLLAYMPFQFRFLAKDSLFKTPFLGWHLKRSGNIPIHRENPVKSVKSIKNAAQKVKEGTSLCIFPEGSRSSDGKIREFKPGVFYLAILSQKPILPVTIIGSRFLLPKGSIKIRSGKIKVIISDPIDTSQYTKKDIEKLIKIVKDRIISNFDEKLIIKNEVEKDETINFQ